MITGEVCLGRWTRLDRRSSTHRRDSGDHDGDIAKKQSGERQASHRNTVCFAEELIRF